MSIIFPEYSSAPGKVVSGIKIIADFIGSEEQENADKEVVESFGEEWSKFSSFNEDDLDKLGREYFDIIPEKLLSRKTNVLDVGCGTGRWSKYLADKVGTISLVDPSKAIYVADKLLSKNENIRLAKAYANSLPFLDNQFDLVMSIGVLHHIPDTLSGMKECVKKVKPGGYFYVYLYYSLDNRGPVFKAIFAISNLLRKIVSSLPSVIKKIVCDILAITVYMPFVFLSRLLFKLGLKKLSQKIPLSSYRDKSFHIIRNDSLDRFGTKLEKRFSREEVKLMMEQSGLKNVMRLIGMQ
jgi:ubiquinone/menaquinone biosynthesis C-methylase UbiE